MRAPIAVVITLVLGSPARAESPGLPDAATLIVTSTAELRDAMAVAVPGDIIEVAAGTYAIDASLVTGNPGDAAGRIVVRGRDGVVFESTIAEAFKVTQPFWSFEHLEIRGVCTDDSTCEHAFHITGNADQTIVTYCRLVDFNAQIKGNGDLTGPGGERVWPDDVTITRSQLFDTRPRQTANPVTKIDVVGGRRWRITFNDLHDFEKAGGDFVSYAAFLKGNSRDGVMANNRVTCAQAFTGGARIGLSLGGGGSGPDPICEDGTCTPEHQNGLIYDNVIASCSDVGIYLNEATGTRIVHNTVYGTTGVDVRYAASTAALQSNLIGGGIHDRDGGTHTSTDDLDVTPDQWTAWFTNPAGLEFHLRDGAALVDRGAVISDIVFDICGNDRDDGRPDLGAYEYDEDLLDPTIPCVFRPGSGPDADPGPTPDAGGPGGTGDGGGCCGTTADPRGSLLLVALIALGVGRRRPRSDGHGPAALRRDRSRIRPLMLL